MDNAVVKSTIKYVKENYLPFTSEELAKVIGVSAEDAERAVGKLAYLGIVEIDDRDGRIFPNGGEPEVVPGGLLNKQT